MPNIIGTNESWSAGAEYLNQTSTAGFLDGPLSSARFGVNGGVSSIANIFYHHQTDNLVFMDTSNMAIRRVDLKTQMVYTIATYDFATEAMNDLYVDEQGYIYVAIGKKKLPFDWPRTDISGSYPTSAAGVTVSDLSKADIFSPSFGLIASNPCSWPIRITGIGGQCWVIDIETVMVKSYGSGGIGNYLFYDIRFQRYLRDTGSGQRSTIMQLTVGLFDPTLGNLLVSGGEWASPSAGGFWHIPFLRTSYGQPIWSDASGSDAPYTEYSTWVGTPNMQGFRLGMSGSKITGTYYGKIDRILETGYWAVTNERWHAGGGHGMTVGKYGLFASNYSALSSVMAQPNERGNYDNAYFGGHDAGGGVDQPGSSDHFNGDLSYITSINFSSLQNGTGRLARYTPVIGFHTNTQQVIRPDYSATDPGLPAPVYDDSSGPAYGDPRIVVPVPGPDTGETAYRADTGLDYPFSAGLF